MCFSQSSLYYCQRRWSGLIDEAMVRSFRMFRRLLLESEGHCSTFRRRVCEAYVVYIDAVLA